MPIITPDMKSLGKAILAYMPMVANYELSKHGNKWKLYFRLHDEPIKYGYQHWIEGGLREIKAGVMEYGKEYRERQRAKAAPTGTT